MGPPLSGDSHSRLDLIHYEQCVVLVNCFDSSFEILFPEVVVSPLPLYGFHYECCYVVLVLLERCFHFRYAPVLQLLYVPSRFLVQRETDLWVCYPGPVELGEVHCFPGIECVGQAHGIACSSVERLLQVDYLASLLTLLSIHHVLPHFPVEGGLQGVFNCECTPVYEEEVLHVIRTCFFGECVYKSCHFRRVDIRVRDLRD